MNKLIQKKMIFAIALISCIAGYIISAVNIDQKYPPTSFEDLLYMPSGKFLKGAALGYDEVFADLLWIKALAYFGGHAKSNQDYTWLGHILDVITTLDPLFQYPYEFGGVVLATEVHDVDNSNYLLKKGMENVPRTHERYWYFPFFTAFNYMYYKNDYQTAAHYLSMAAEFPQSPDYIPLLVSRLYADANSPEIAITFLKEMIHAAKKPELKEKLVIRLNEVINKNNIDLLEKVKNEFFLQFNRYPENMDELSKKGLISSIPVDPRSGEYYIDNRTHTIKNTKKMENLKVHIKKSSKPDIEMLPLPMQKP